MKSQIIPIAYQGGTYGTYLEWCLTSLTSTDQLVSPFTAVGDSHKFCGSEAWIQWQLRNLGYEIQCHGLDKFPTNSVHLHELLYQPKST